MIRLTQLSLCRSPNTKLCMLNTGIMKSQVENLSDLLCTHMHLQPLEEEVVAAGKCK